MSGFLCTMVGATFTVAATGQVLRAKKTITTVGIAQVSTAQSKFGGASLLLDDSPEAYLTVAHTSDMLTGTSAFTVEGWFRPQLASFQDGAGTRFVFFKGVNSATGFGFGVTTDGVRFRGPSTDDLVYTGSIPSSAWTHLAFVYDGTNKKIYVNGTQQATAAASLNVTDTSNYQIGYFTSNFAYNGYVDELRVSNILRYSANFTAPTTPFIDDDNTVLLIHADGTNASTVFTDDNGIGRSQRGISAIGNAQVSTAQSKFGGASLLLDGNADGIIARKIATFGTGDFTIEGWVRSASLALENYYVFDCRNTIDASQAPGANLAVIYSGGTDIAFFTGGATLVGSTSYAANTFQHFALVRSNGVAQFYFNGIGSANSHALTTNFAECDITFGSYAGATGGGDFIGHIDEMRVSNTARYTANFTPSTTAFVNDVNTLLLIHADGTNASTVFTDDNAQLTVTPAATSVNEGSSLTFNVSTINTADQTLYYSLTNSGDFSTSTGSFSLTSNAGSFSVTPTADVTTEGAETFTAQIRIGSTSGGIVNTSSAVTINDTSVPTASAFTDDANTVLLAHFNGTNNSTSFTDDNSSGRTAKTIGFDPANAFTGGVISTAQSKYGGASLYLSQSGNSMFVQVPVAQNADFGFTGDFTIEAYVYQTDSSGFRVVTSNWEDAWLLAISGGTAIQFFAKGALNINATGLTVTSNTWHHIAVTRSGSTTKIWFNGTQVGSSGTLSGTLTVNDATAIGANINNNPESNPNSFFQGYIDEVRLSNICRYTATFTPGL